MHAHAACVTFIGSSRKPFVIPISATSYAPGLVLSPRNLVYGDVACYNHRNLDIHLTNMNADLTVCYRVRRSLPYYSADPPHAVIAPGGNATLSVRYNPQALGKHSGLLTIETLSEQNVVLCQQTLRVAGTSMVMGPKPKRAGGLDALPEDFVRPPHFADELTIAASVRAKPPVYVRQKVWEKADLAPRFANGGPQDMFAYSQRDQMLVSAQRSMYGAFLKKAHAMRTQKTAKVVPDDDTQLGLDTWGSLGQAGLTLPKQKDPLWLANSNRPAQCTPYKGFPAEQCAAIEPFKVRVRAVLVGRSLLWWLVLAIEREIPFPLGQRRL